MHVVVVSSSTRPNRTTHKVAKAILASVKASGNKGTMLDLMDHPLPMLEYTYSSHPNPTDAMNNINTILNGAEAFIFVSPEYNGSFSPALKNLVDYFAKKPFTGKAIGTATVSVGGMGGMRAAIQMQLLIIGAFGYPSPNMLLTGQVNDKFDENDKVTDEGYHKKLHAFVQEIVSLGNALSTKTKT